MISGAGAIDEDDILAAITTREYGILQRAAIKADVEKIRRQLEEEVEKTTQLYNDKE